VKHAHLVLAALLSGCAAPARVVETPPVATASPVDSTTIAQKTRGLDRRPGLLTLFLDPRQERLLLEIPRDSTRVLMFHSLATGFGSNPIGLDRAASAGSYVTRFERHGDKVHVIFENWSYRTSLPSRDHAQTVVESFAYSTVAALPVVAEENGRLLVDVTAFVMRDWLDVTASMTAGNQGTYALDRERSSIYRPYTKAFPENTEIDVALTFTTGGRPGDIVSRILPDARAFTLRQHLSFVRLPDEGYRPRRVDPRVGFFGIQFHDFGQPIQQWLEQRWINRFRLERANPRDPNSPIRNPIVFYVDRGIPEPMRRATIEGAKFWEQAFDRAGLRGGFRVEDLPESADPLDARYNIVIWLNRHERGWSFGGLFADPRTGEILKGLAHMDSHRARTDYNLYAGLLGADAAAADTAFVLARVRQVTAHEIGHTIGMAHNYIASTYERGSVMDYPPPRVRLDARGEIDISQAYDVGPGEYDVWAVRWGYGIYPAENEGDSLRAIVAEGLRRRFLFLSDGDARPEYASDPRTNLWDDAGTATEFLSHQMNVRRVALGRFGERNIRPGEPLALLQERFAPVYLMHRFALASVAKTIGGMEYHNALRGDGQQATRPIPGARQREALRAMIDALRRRSRSPTPSSRCSVRVPSRTSRMSSSFRAVRDPRSTSSAPRARSRR
jgi:hypothetical protein